MLYETEQKVRFLNLDDAQKKLCSSAEDMGKFSTEFAKLVAENQRLLEENKNRHTKWMILITGFKKAEK